VTCPEHDLADAGILCEVPAPAIPRDDKTPNTRLWREFDKSGKLVTVDPIADPEFEHLKGLTRLRTLELSHVRFVTEEGVQ
jgi:hypothetical protein